MSGIVNIREESEDDFVFGIKSEGLGGLEEISAISSSLSGVSVKGEESVELSDVFWCEDGVLGGDVFSKDGLEFFGLDFFL